MTLKTLKNVSLHHYGASRRKAGINLKSMPLLLLGNRQEFLIERKADTNHSQLHATLL